MSKLASLLPHNAGTAIPTHQALIAVFDPETGSPVALLDGTEITAVRTGACSALSVRLLAREDASVLAVLGTGAQARSHARAVVRVRPITEIRIAGRDPRKAAALAAELAQELGLPVRAAASYREALEAADVVCAATHAPEPVVNRQWLAPGVHVTSVGYNPAGRELDDQTVVDALVCVESRRAALAPVPAGSNDLTQPIRDGLITAEHVHAELGELVSGTKPRRTSQEQITLYKSVGVASRTQRPRHWFSPRLARLAPDASSRFDRAMYRRHTGLADEPRMRARRSLNRVRDAACRRADWSANGTSSTLWRCTGGTCRDSSVVIARGPRTSRRRSFEEPRGQHIATCPACAAEQASLRQGRSLRGLAR
jgi:alanine dehydrogenase